jgi:hypothetical protein
MIEDLGSSNGTSLNSVERRVTGPTPLAETDTLYFGTMAVPAIRLLAGRRERTGAAADSPSGAAGPELRQAPKPTLLAIGTLDRNRWTAAALAQGPIIGILIVLVFGRQASAAITESSWASVGHGIASATFALALAAVWLGCSLAVAELAAGRLPGRNPGADVAKHLVWSSSRLVVLCILECAILLAIVHWGSGFKAPWMATWGMLVMASLVGLLLGLFVATFIRTAARPAVLLMGFSLMIALGGWAWPLPGMSPPFALAAAAMPTRWAFEGLLLLEAQEHPAPIGPEGSNPDQRLDFAEGFFPVGSERMGPRADALALGSMQIGLAALAALFWGHLQSGP